MFQQFEKISVIARLRCLTLMAVLAMLGMALGLIWSGYQQRVSDRQAAVKQAVEMAHARIQLAYAPQQFGRLDVVHAQKQALAALDKLDDLKSALLTQTALTVGAVLLMAMILWGLLETTAKELKASAKPAMVPAASKLARGPLAYAQGQQARPRPATSHSVAFAESELAQDAGESPAQEAKRLRMAGAI